MTKFRSLTISLLCLIVIVMFETFVLNYVTLECLYNIYQHFPVISSF